VCEPSQPTVVGQHGERSDNSLVRRQPLDIVDGVFERGYMQMTTANRELPSLQTIRASNAQGAAIQDMSV
jgi:hypothetical protein